MAMDNMTLSLMLSIVAIIIALVTFFLMNNFRQSGKKQVTSFNTLPLQLQAYERLVVFAERIALPNLISRLNQPGLSAREMQLLLLGTIKQEFEYNSSQQIYVSPVAWQAVNKLKEQNMLIINQVAQILPEGANGTDLNKKIMEVIIAQDKNALHNIVLNALNFEARKLMN
jgi:hypothetical protein